MSEKLIIKRRKGNEVLPEGKQISVNLQTDQTTLLDLKKEIFKITKIQPLRQWLTFEDLKTVLDDNKKPIKLLGLNNGQTLVVKDLGPQMLWITVFYAEYVGPILVFLVLYYLGDRSKYNFMQKSAFWMIFGHYAKRMLETKFVHVFSRDSMPTQRALINCFHYWILCGLFIGSELYLLRSFEQTEGWKQWLIAGFGIFEFMNLMCHVTLSQIRKSPKEKGDYVALNKQRAIPYGYGFDQVSSANYFWETMSWVSFSIFTGSYASIGFTCFSFYQMMVWAKQKHRRYRQEFGDKFPRGRKAIVPFLI